ncbi:MAG: hypothetical protein RIQ71_1596 [Verrucomicrobiota bacterium]|jgi:SAM-dependent methyltransferase
MVSAVHAFFSQWDIYRLCIEHNTLCHREVGAILRDELAGRTEPFSFLDLACGDAELTAGALRGSRVARYAGVDFAQPAIELAREKTSDLPCPREFHEANLTDFLRGNAECFDVLYLGLSLHHLERDSKREMMTHLRRATAPGGAFYMFEPCLRPGESRDIYIDRWARAINGPYDPFPATARDALLEHVRESELPETREEYLSSASDAGFARGEILFTDPGNFYTLFKFSI